MFFVFLQNIFAARGLLSISVCVVLALVPTNVIRAQTQNNNAGDAIQTFNLGQDAHEKGDFKTALKFYDEALKAAPEFPEAEFQRGNALVSLNRTAEAEKSFRRAVELRPDWTLPMTNLGALLVGRNEFAEAETLLDRAVADAAPNFSAYAALTELRLKTKAAAPVLKILLAKIQTLTAKANAPAAIWASRAALERFLGDVPAAKTSVNRALIIEPNDKQALNERAEIALVEADDRRAFEDAQAILRQTPDSVSAKILLARVYAAQNKPDAALQILDALRNSSPEAATLRDALAAASSINTLDLEKQLEGDARNRTILSRLCSLLRTDDPPKALEYCRRAAEVEPDNINHAVGYGAALVQAKQFAAAASLLRRILQIAPDNFTARANLATALFEAGRFADARTEYLRLIEQQPDLAITYYLLAITHDKLNEFPDALANYQQFLKRADADKNRLEIEKVNLRLPSLRKRVKSEK